MTLYNDKKLSHLEKAKGKYVGASTKLNNYEHGREKAKKIATSAKSMALRNKKTLPDNNKTI